MRRKYVSDALPLTGAYSILYCLARSSRELKLTCAVSLFDPTHSSVKNYWKCEKPNRLFESRHSEKGSQVGRVWSDDDESKQPPGRRHQSPGYVLRSFASTLKSRTEMFSWKSNVKKGRKYFLLKFKITSITTTGIRILIFNSVGENDGRRDLEEWATSCRTRDIPSSWIPSFPDHPCISPCYSCTNTDWTCQKSTVGNWWRSRPRWCTATPLVPGPQINFLTKFPKTPLWLSQMEDRTPSWTWRESTPCQVSSSELSFPPDRSKEPWNPRHFPFRPSQTTAPTLCPPAKHLTISTDRT